MSLHYRMLWRSMLAVTLCGATAGGLRAQHAAGVPVADAVSLADDAYHYAEWADGRRDALYTEWWYFNVQDPRSGTKAIFSYFVSNPSDIARLAQVQMVAVAYTPAGIVKAMDRYPAAAFEASDQVADVTIDPGADDGERAAALNTIRVDADGAYRIGGATRDGRLAWDLTYVTESRPWFAADRMQVGALAWERMSWLVFMPRARVTGSITVDGLIIPVDGSGYHDHNWGEWIPSDALWNWAQFSSGRVALEVGDFIGKPVGMVGVDVDGERTVFTPGQYSLRHVRWAWDAVNRLFYPVESRLVADNGSIRLQVTIRAVETAPLRGDLPLPLQDLVIYEQTAQYDGIVWERTGGGADATGTWRIRARLRGTGFKEYTAKHW